MKFTALAAVALASVASLASASHFVAYKGDHFSGATASLGGCGCKNIPHRGSYKWYGEGQSASLYNAASCKGTRHSTLATDKNSQSSTSFGWKSIFIQC